MLIGYMRVSKADGSQTTDPQRDAQDRNQDGRQISYRHVDGPLPARVSNRRNPR